jgi:hypothetical protein
MTLPLSGPGPAHDQVESVINSTLVQLMRTVMNLVVGPVVVAALLWTGNNYYQQSQTLVEIKTIVSNHTAELAEATKSRDEQAKAIKQQVADLGNVKLAAAKVDGDLQTLGAKLDWITKRLDGDESSFHPPR